MSVLSRDIAWRMSLRDRCTHVFAWKTQGKQRRLTSSALVLGDEAPYSECRVRPQSVSLSLRGPVFAWQTPGKPEQRLTSSQTALLGDEAPDSECRVRPQSQSMAFRLVTLVFFSMKDASS